MRFTVIWSSLSIKQILLKYFTFRQLLPTYLRGSFQSLSTWTLTASWRGRKSCSLSGGEVWEMTEACWQCRQCRQCSQQRLLTEWRGEATEQKTSITSTMKQGETRLNNVKQHIMLNRKKRKKHEGHVSMNFDESCSWQREALRLLEKALAQLRDLFASAELGSHWRSRGRSLTYAWPAPGRLWWQNALLRLAFTVLITSLHLCS